MAGRTRSAPRSQRIRASGGDSCLGGSTMAEGAAPLLSVVSQFMRKSGRLAKSGANGTLPCRAATNKRSRSSVLDSECVSWGGARVLRRGTGSQELVRLLARRLPCLRWDRSRPHYGHDDSVAQNRGSGADRPARRLGLQLVVELAPIGPPAVPRAQPCVVGSRRAQPGPLPPPPRTGAARSCRGQPVVLEPLRRDRGGAGRDGRLGGR